jgi:phosphate transport system permease protein
MATSREKTRTYEQPEKSELSDFEALKVIETGRPAAVPTAAMGGQVGAVEIAAGRSSAPWVRTPKREAWSATGAVNLGDRIFRGVTMGFAGFVLIVLALMIGILVLQGWPSISTFGLSFLTSSTWNTVTEQYGALPAVEGTIYSAFLALLLAAPIGVLIAIFLVEMAPFRFRVWLGFLVELLVAVPSIVYGLWAFFVLVPLVRDYVEPIFANHFGSFPLFSGYPLGIGMFSAALVLAIMILPTIASLSRDVVQAVPNQQREAMLALGATRWETTWKVVIPYARSGIIGGIILGLGRAVGETMAVQMVIGNTYSFSTSLFNTATTMPATLVNQFNDATSELNRAALVELALILLLVTVVLNAGARFLVWSVTRRQRA